ncbi:MerR family transcriptional regulator [Jannaschia rubra]|uniref:MerR family transcriptional regulator n=1 Tax=Jannaschia rubra TaxID=282197 RepID=UPI0024926F94|nr:MerR family transcriptional regulator [Jannaschia rubra]
MAGPPEKSDGAFRTIREVADWLGVPTHVLRFWESKFEQIAPVKGAGGRRYYRPEDMRLLGGIKVMLHDQGLTIRGVSQKIDDDGLDAVTRLSPNLDGDDPTPGRTRRVIRPDDSRRKADERVGPFEREPDEDTLPQPTDPASETMQPDAPADTKQLGDAPIDAPQPGVDPTDTAHRTEPPPPQPDAPKPALAPLAVLRPGHGRQLRRIVRRLRGLIDDVEAELSSGGNS